MSKLVNENFINDIDSLIDLESFNSKYVQVSGISSADDDDKIINQFKFVKTKFLKNKNRTDVCKLVEFKESEKDDNTKRLNSDFKKGNMVSKFSLENYLKRIADKILNKKGIRNVVLNLLAKEEIDLENVILFRKLTSRSNKKDYVETLSKVVMNVIEK